MWSLTWFPNERRLVRGVCAAAVVAAACARDTPPPASDSGTTPAAVSDHTGNSADTSCAKSGAWQPCNVLDRLEHAGLVLKQQPAATRIPLFSVDGITYETNRATIHVFLYPDQAARRRDTDQLDSATVAPRGGVYQWSDPAVLVTSNNLAAVIVSPNERQTERIVLALSAGLPAARP
jgi:hypothetical protein